MRANFDPSTQSFTMRRTASQTMRHSTLTVAVLSLLSHAAWAQNARPLYPLANPLAAVPGQQSAVLRGASGPVDYSANATAAHLVVEVSKDGIPADGQSAVMVTVRVLGADGKPLANSVLATIEHSGGRILLPGATTDESGPGAKDLDRATPGVQVEVRQGVARFNLLAPSSPQDVRLRVTVGAQEASGSVSFVPDMREMVAAGLLEGVINISGRGSVLEPSHRDDGFEREILHFSNVSSDGRVSAGARSAFFLKGVVKGEYLLTAAYDSDKELRSRLADRHQAGRVLPGLRRCLAQGRGCQVVHRAVCSC